jgi:hypothetical protein
MAGNNSQIEICSKVFEVAITFWNKARELIIHQFQFDP